MHDRLKSLRRAGFWGAASANVLNMIGVGPFLTIPLALGRDGRTAGHAGMDPGSIHFAVRWNGLGGVGFGDAVARAARTTTCMEAFGPQSFGRLFSFLFLWQAIVLGPISIASGAVGFAQYAGYLLPNMHHAGSVALAAAVCLVNTALLYRNIRSISYLSIATARYRSWIDGVDHRDRRDPLPSRHGL